MLAQESLAGSPTGKGYGLRRVGVGEGSTWGVGAGHRVCQHRGSISQQHHPKEVWIESYLMPHHPSHLGDTIGRVSALQKTPARVEAMSFPNPRVPTMEAP